MKISLVVPCYNEEQCIEKYYEAMKPIREKIPEEFEFVFVDDGSKDKTLSIIKDLAKKDKQVRFISFSRNFGKEAAMYAGLKAATGDWFRLWTLTFKTSPNCLSICTKASPKRVTIASRVKEPRKRTNSLFYREFFTAYSTK